MSLYGAPDPSLTDFSYTFHNSKLSCSKDFFVAHIFFAYLVAFTGIAAFVTRLIPRFNWLHLWFGRAYILAMFWATGTSMMIHNTGLPVGVLWSFLWVGLGITFGWLVITIHQKNRTRRGKNVDQANEEPQTRTKWQKILDRMLTLKAVHGVLMWVSFINILGRIFATPGLSKFECHTYPVYKPISGHHHNGTVTYVPGQDPVYGRLPWAYNEGGWAAGMGLGMATLGIAVGFIYLYFTIPSTVLQTANSKKVSPESSTKSTIKQSSEMTDA